MIAGSDMNYITRYQDPFIAAVPGSLLLTEAFNVILDFIQSGNFPFNDRFHMIQRNNEWGVNFMPRLF